MAVLKTVTKFIVYAVTFPTGERSSGSPIYFAHESDAKKCASLKRGWYGSNGSVMTKEYGHNDIPSYFEEFDEWARDSLTVNEYENLK